MMRDTSVVMKYLMEIETLADDILCDKQQIVGLDFKRNKNREGARCLTNSMMDPKAREKSWLCFGNTFIQLQNDKAKSLLERDQNSLDQEINNLRNNLKPKVNQLRQLEGKPELTGFALQPLSKDEMSAINQVLVVRS